MATIQARPGRGGGTHYRVQIRLHGARASATFPTLAAARRWATMTEGALRTQRQFPTLEAAHRTLDEVLARYAPTRQARSMAMPPRSGQQQGRALAPPGGAAGEAGGGAGAGGVWGV